MDDQTWWAAQMDGSRAKYARCSGAFDAAGDFIHDGRVCNCGFGTEARAATVSGLIRQERARLAARHGRLSGCQVSYAKGRASQRFFAIEREVMREP